MRTIFRLLGTVTIAVDEAEVPLETPMVRALVAALLLDRNHYVSLERLAHLLWQSRPASALPNVRTYATRLRAAFALTGPDLAGRFTSRRASGYRLAASADELDLVRFADLTARGRSLLSDGRYDEAAAVLHEGLALWQGAAGDDLPADSPIRKVLYAVNERRQHAAADLVEARLARGETTALIPELRVAVTDRPVDERSWGQLIRALHSSGDPGAALHAYAQARTNLRDELGIEPSKELQVLHRAVLNRDTVAVPH